MEGPAATGAGEVARDAPVLRARVGETRVGTGVTVASAAVVRGSAMASEDRDGGRQATSGCQQRNGWHASADGRRVADQPGQGATGAVETTASPQLDVALAGSTGSVSLRITSASNLGTPIRDRLR